MHGAFACVIHIRESRCLFSDAFAFRRHSLAAAQVILAACGSRTSNKQPEVQGMHAQRPGEYQIVLRALEL